MASDGDLESINAYWTQALEHHARGSFAAAIEFYNRVLAGAPDLSHGYCNRAGALLALGQTEAALGDLDRALACDADCIEAYNLRGAVLLELKRPDEALEAIGKALSLRPAYPHALNNKGLALEATGQLESALAAYDEATHLWADFLPPWQNRGNVLARLGRREEALSAFDQAIALAPDDADLLRYSGEVLEGLCEFDRALERYDRATAILPSADALISRGNALVGLARREEAVGAYDRALSLAPGLAEALYLKGVALKEMAAMEAAMACFELASRAVGEDVRSLNAVGLALTQLGHFEESLVLFDRAAELEPRRADIHHNRGVALRDLRRTQEALEAYDRAIELAPAVAHFRLNRGMEQISLGNYAEGLDGLEWRKRMKGRQDMGYRAYPAPEWTGLEPLAGKTLFVHSEQGLGDSLQYCRYLPLVAERGARVIFSVQDKLIRLVSTLSPLIPVIGADQTPDAFDYHISVMSLPWAFKTDAATIPSQVPYLKADKARVKRWRRDLGDEGFKIGIAWQGSLVGTAIGKAFHPQQFKAIADLPQVRLVSLQKGPGSEALGELTSMTVETLGDDFDAGADAFLDTAAVMESLDLIITTDTSVAHLAGALARPTWMALKYVPDCRWGLQAQTTAWYPTMRLFRQPAPRDWDSVFVEMTQALARMIAKA